MTDSNQTGGRVSGVSTRRRAITPAHATIFIIAVVLLLAGCGRSPVPERGALEDRIRSMLELPTYEQIYRDVVYVDRERSFLLFKRQAQVLFSIDIRVQAGIDFETGLAVIPDPDGTGVTVRLPKARILLIDADEETIRQYFATEAGGPIERLAYYDEINRIKSEIAQDAIEREILEKAEINARSLITGLLVAAGFEEVRFVPA